MCEVLTIGEPMVLFVADKCGRLDDIEHFTKFLAGSEVNVAIGLNRLGHSISYITNLGDDPFGRYIYKFLQREGIDTTYIKFDMNNPTGFQIKEKVIQGDPEVVSFRRGSAASRLHKNDLEGLNLDKIRHIHLTGIPPALSSNFREVILDLIDKAKVKGIGVTFDPNLRPKLWSGPEEMKRIINDVARHCDIILPGIQEGEILTGSREPEGIANFYLEKGVQTVIVKTGESGAFVKTRHNNVGSTQQYESYTVPGFKVDKVVDTVGAGDGFAVGVISGLLENQSLHEAVVRGNAIGSLQVMSPGDNDGLPDKKTLDEYLCQAR
ncbi:MAG: sugar kinase [Desulfitobacteriaceae bacterium]